MDALVDDPLNLLRIAVMLVFIAAFLGMLAWLARPGAKGRGLDASMIPLRDDAAPEPSATRTPAKGAPR